MLTCVLKSHLSSESSDGHFGHTFCQVTGLKALILCLSMGKVRPLTVAKLRRVQKATLKLESKKKAHEGENLDPNPNVNLSTLEVHCPGRFLGMIGQGPNVSKSNQLTCCDLLDFLIIPST